MRAYSDPNRENDPHALPNVEIFYNDSALQDALRDDDGGKMEDGYYYWFCFPGCMPDSGPVGPFDSEEAALANARGGK